MSIQPWRIVTIESEDGYRIFRVRRERAVSPRSGVSHEFVVISAPDWVNVIARTPDGEAVFVRQYRHGTRSVTLEIPGGMVDPGETPQAAARRELLEETGFAGDTAVLIGAVHPNPAIQGNLCHTVLIEGARRVADPTPEPAEEIDVELIPVQRIAACIATGAISHALVIAAFHHLHLRDVAKT
jgi:8-oxo-dGTP pyrophosphatase MutT (NUDIX family)